MKERRLVLPQATRERPQVVAVAVAGAATIFAVVPVPAQNACDPSHCLLAAEGRRRVTRWWVIGPNCRDRSWCHAMHLLRAVIYRPPVKHDALRSGGTWDACGGFAPPAGAQRATRRRMTTKMLRKEVELRECRSQLAHHRRRRNPLPHLSRCRSRRRRRRQHRRQHRLRAGRALPFINPESVYIL